MDDQFLNYNIRYRIYLRYRIMASSGKEHKEESLFLLGGYKAMSDLESKLGPLISRWIMDPATQKIALCMSKFTTLIDQLKPNPKRLKRQLSETGNDFESLEKELKKELQTYESKLQVVIRESSIKAAKLASELKTPPRKSDERTPLVSLSLHSEKGYTEIEGNPSADVVQQYMAVQTDASILKDLSKLLHDLDSKALNFTDWDHRFKAIMKKSIQEGSPKLCERVDAFLAILNKELRSMMTQLEQFRTEYNSIYKEESSYLSHYPFIPEGIERFQKIISGISEYIASTKKELAGKIIAAERPSPKSG